MGKQLELTANHTCDKCKQSKPRAFSYFTARMWFCEDCTGQQGGREVNPKIMKIVKEAQESQVSFENLLVDLIAARRQYYNEISEED